MRLKPLQSLLLTLSFSVFTLFSAPAFPAGIESRIAVGNVYSRGVAIERDAQGNVISEPVLVRFDDNGAEYGQVDLGDYAGSVYQLKIISGAEYAADLDLLQTLKTDPDNAGAQLLSYQQIQSTGLFTISNEPINLGEGINDNFASYLIKAKSQRFSTRGQDAVIHRFVLDLSEANESLKTAKSIVIAPDGRVISSSASHRIGFRSGFFGNPNEPQYPATSAPRFRPGEANVSIYRPLVGQRVELLSNYGFGSGLPGDITSGLVSRPSVH